MPGSCFGDFYCGGFKHTQISKASPETNAVMLFSIHLPRKDSTMHYDARNPDHGMQFDLGLYTI